MRKKLFAFLCLCLFLPIVNVYADTNDSDLTGSVTLSMPYYEQKDILWSNERLGNSESTIGEAGSLLMAYSTTYRYLNDYVSPLEINERFNELGEPDWQQEAEMMGAECIISNEIEEDALFETIAHYIQDGYPVILQLISNDGFIHYVVAYQYSAHTQEIHVKDSSAYNYDLLSDFVNWQVGGYYVFIK